MTHIRKKFWELRLFTFVSERQHGAFPVNKYHLLKKKKKGNKMQIHDHILRKAERGDI